MTKPFVIPKALVWEAFQRVKANGGSAGVDNESIEGFEKSLGDNLYKLWNRMGSGSYFPPPVKAVPIPKKSGGTRMLGVPTVADRVAQTVVKMVLEPVLEPVFDRDSFGYRPRRSALDAVALVRRRSWEYDWVVEFDIKGLFLRPAASRFSRIGFQYLSSASHTGFQYWAVDSMTTSSASCSSSHAASVRSWSGLLPNIRRSNWYSLSISTSDTTTASIFL